ncbi:hypothetical protein PR048_010962 [Dryococelus australis]|uniref:Transposase n=1 Tax=Dryococelus australis TaxID=614101 RepID=A0ABQ9HKY2_9NEOP|nr:hypothetical protein PR048_010962 [Dryococelus australis]
MSKNVSHPTKVVKRIVEPIAGTNRSVTGDNWFTSIELLDAKTRGDFPDILFRLEYSEYPQICWDFRKKNPLDFIYTKKGQVVNMVSSVHQEESVKKETNTPEII